MTNHARHSPVAVVTGAGGGIGAATATALAASGRIVVVADREIAAARQVAERITAEGGTASAAAVDVADSGSVDQLVRATADQLGRVDVLVNVAGILRDGRLDRMTDDDWDAVIDVNLVGTIRVTTAFLRLLRRAATGGRIVNVGSRAALGAYGQTAYGASKAGVLGYTVALATAVARDGITVNSVSPGLVDTPMLGALDAPVLQRLAASVPVGRLATPNEVAGAIVFLASPDAAYITGQDLAVCGGRTRVAARGGWSSHSYSLSELEPLP